MNWLADRLPIRPSLVIGGVACLLLLASSQVFPHEVPLGTVLYGVIYGSLNGLLAIGLVLTFRVTRAINFAYGSMGGLSAGVAVSLYLGHGWSWGIILPVGLVLGAVIGLGVGALINWRFSNAPRMVLTVATIGLSQLLGGIALFVPKWLHAPSLIPNLRNGLSRWRFEVRPVLFTGNDVVVIAVVPVVLVVVTWFLLRTDSGRAVRAIADNSDRARLVGIPAKRLMLGVWTITGVVAALAALLAAPTEGIALTGAVGPALLLPPLAAAVVARMESLTVAFTAAVALGVVEEVVRLNIQKQSVETVVFLAVILVALLSQRRSESRAEAADESSWSGTGALQPIPQVLRSLREVRLAQIAGLALLVVVALGIPLWVQAGPLHNITTGLIFAMAALSLVVLSGWAGTVSLGQMAIVGIGAIVSGDLMVHLNLDFFFSMLAAAGAGALAAVLLGLPALRVRGVYLAVTTLAFAVAAEDYFFNPSNYSSILPASIPIPVLWKRFPLANPRDIYFLCLAVLAVLIVLVTGIRRAQAGRLILATRDNLRATEAAAVSTVRTRLTAFTLAGAIAGIAGALNVLLLGSVGYESFPASDSVTVFAMVVIGGLSSVSGALAGVALIVWLGVAFPQAQLLLTGVGLLVVLMFFPAGLVGLYQRLRDWILVRLARHKGLDVSVWSDADDRTAAPTLEQPVATEAVPPGETPESPDRDNELLRCRGVNASYGQLQVLFGVDLVVNEGEIVALLGTNGAGKSSLLRTMTGLLPASQGTVTFGGLDITRSSTEAIVGHGLTMMPGGRGVFPSLTVDENLQVASWTLRRDKAAAAAARARVITLFPVLGVRSGQAAGDLSGGEQQMLSLGMALLMQPRVLCIDELSLGLAPTVVATLVDAVRELHRQGTTVLVVEQSVSVALLLAERATFLEKGQVRFSGDANDLLERSDLLRAVFIGGGAPDNQSPDVDPAGAADPILITPVGHPISRFATSAPASATAATTAADGDVGAALECIGLTKRFGGITAVDGIDLTVMPHEIVGLIGHNGAGKTTLFDLISGFLQTDGGQISIDDEDVTYLAPFDRAIGGLGRSFQEARLFPSLTVTETLSVALNRHLARGGPISAAFRMPAATDVELDVTEQVVAVIEMLGLGAYRHRPTGELSTGTRRIVELACIIVQRPSLLLLDEPSAGVAQAETVALAPLLRTVTEETGCAMVIIEHDMQLLASTCHRLVALEQGAVIADGPPSAVLSHPLVIASYLGTDPDATHGFGSARDAGSPTGDGRRALAPNR